MASAILAALEQHRAALAGLLGASVHQDGGLLAVCHPRLAWPWLNYACPVAPPAAGAPGRAAARLAAAGRMPAFVLPAPRACMAAGWCRPTGGAAWPGPWSAAAWQTPLPWAPAAPLPTRRRTGRWCGSGTDGGSFRRTA